MDILIIGGTRFVGRTLAKVALARGHNLTLFNRGQANPNLFPQVRRLHGDRNSDLSALDGGSWDVVIDTCAYFPRQVRSLLEKLTGNPAIKQYVLISTVSVYRDTRAAGNDETYPVGTIPDETVETIDNETYGPLKALCERTAEELFPGKVLTIRPGLIVGPYDPSDRFTYWPARIQRGGEVLAPGEPDRRIQLIDVRDLTEWILRLVENNVMGVFNATGEPGALTMEALLLTCKQVTQAAARLTWVDDNFLSEHNVGPWIEMPLWIPSSDPDSAGFFTLSVNKAIGCGLEFRAITDTIRATFAWENTRPHKYQWKAGLTPQREAQLLEAFSRRHESA